MPSITEVTEGLAASRTANRAALNELMGAVYQELRRVARRHMARQHPGHTLQTTDLAAPITVKREWARARAWLHRELQPETAG